jgi:exosome complex exonuclease DIS3/RRP44
LDTLFSPFSAKKDKTRGKKDSESDVAEVEAEEVQSVEMLEEGERKGQKKAQPLTDMLTIHETVATRVKEALSSLPTDNEFLTALVPALTTAVAIAVGEVMGAVLVKLEEKLEEKLKPVSAAASDLGLVAVVRRLTYANDKLEQYTRRESVRIFGVKQDDRETVEEVETKTLKVLRDAGVEVVPEDIAAVHRVGKRQNSSRPILVKFVSRRKRREVMVNKKTLKGKQGYERVFIGDDLTPLRARLLGTVKKLPNVEKAWVVDGRIHVQRKYPTGLDPDDRPRPVIVESPDDLFRLGVNHVDYAALGLPHLAFGEAASGGE